MLVHGLCGRLITPQRTPLDEEINSSAPVRQHIFIKETASLPNGELQITGAQVPYTLVRHGYLDSDLLQYDPGLSKADPGTQLLSWQGKSLTLRHKAANAY